MSFSPMFGSPAASPSVLGLRSGTSSPASSYGSPRTNITRRKRKQAKLVNPAKFYDFSLKSEGFDSFLNEQSGLDFGNSRFLAELSPEPSAPLSIENSPVISPEGRKASCSPALSDNSPITKSPAFPSEVAHPRWRQSYSTTPEGTPERALSNPSPNRSTASLPSGLSTTSPAQTPPRSSSPSFAADGSPIVMGASRNRILTPIDNVASPGRSPVSSGNKSYSPVGHRIAAVRGLSPQKSPQRDVSRVSSQNSINLSERWSDRDVSNGSTGRVTTPRKHSSPNRSSDSFHKPSTPRTPDSDFDTVEDLTRSAEIYEDDYSQSTPARSTRSATMVPSPRELTPPSLPHTPARSRFSNYDGMVTPAPSGMPLQTPRSILRPSNTPATGNSVRFNSVAFYKVIERLPEFTESIDPEESVGDEGTTPLGIEPLEKSEVPMVEPTSSDDEDLDFQPTHYNTLDSIDSDGFDEEVERNTLQNSQTTVQSLNTSFTGDASVLQEPTPPRQSLEATTKWLQDFLVETKSDRVVSNSTTRTVSGSTMRTASNSSLAPEDIPIRHTSPLSLPYADEDDVSAMDNLNNSSEWVVPADLSFGDDSLPRLPGAGFSISAMIDPDATAAARGITPRRPMSQPAWDVPSISKTSPIREDEATPLAPLRSRLAAAKYVSTTPLKQSNSSPSGSPRMGTSPRTTSPPPFGASLRRTTSLEDEGRNGRLPNFVLSSPSASPRRAASPILAAVSEDEEADAESKPKQPDFGSLSRSRPSFPTSLRRSRSVFEDDSVPSSPIKPTLDGKGVSSLSSDISKLSLVDISEQASKISLLERSERSLSSDTSVKSANSGASGSTDTSSSSVNSTVAALAPHAQAMFDAQAAYAKTLEEELIGYRKLIAKCRAEMEQRDVLINKLLPLRDDVVIMRDELRDTKRTNKALQEKLDAAATQEDLASKIDDADHERAIATARLEDAETETEDLRAQLSEAEQKADDLKTQVGEAENESAGLKAQLADAEHANEELKMEVDALRQSKGDEELQQNLQDAEDELTFARSQLREAADETHQVREKLANADSELQTWREECAHLTSEIESVRAERLSATADLEADLRSSRQEIEEFKAELRNMREAITDLKEALAASHDESDSLAAQLKDAQGVSDDAQNALHEARDECASLSADLEKARSHVDSLRAEVDAEARAAHDAEQSVRDLESRLKHAEQSLEDVTSELHRREEDMQRERDLRSLPPPPDSGIKDMRIKALEKQVKRLTEDREMMSVAANSAQIQTELLKRRLSHVENTNKARPLRAVKQTPAPAPRSARVST